MWFNINITEFFFFFLYLCSVKDDLKACLCQQKEVQLENHSIIVNADFYISYLKTK